MIGSNGSDAAEYNLQKNSQKEDICRSPSKCSTVASSSVMGAIPDCISEASSTRQFAESSQTLICVDWDDTLFPTTFLMSQPNFADIKSVHDVSDDINRALRSHQENLKAFLSVACALSDRCAIITNSRSPWVDKCVDRFLPGLKEFMLEQQASGRLKIIYAVELYMERQPRQHAKGSRPVRKVVRTDYESHEMLTAAKFYAMQREASSFYSQYQGQTWKNILSFGDMPYEHHALQEVTWRRVGPVHEQVRTKTITLPAKPSLSELSLGMQLSKALLPTYVNYDGDIDINFQLSENPWKNLSQCLEIPEMTRIAFPVHAWGHACPPSLEEISEAIDELTVILHDHML